MGHFFMLPPAPPTPQEKSLKTGLPSPMKEISDRAPPNPTGWSIPSGGDSEEQSPPWKVSLPSPGPQLMVDMQADQQYIHDLPRVWGLRTD